MERCAAPSGSLVQLAGYNTHAEGSIDLVERSTLMIIGPTEQPNSIERALSGGRPGRPAFSEGMIAVS